MSLGLACPRSPPDAMATIVHFYFIFGVPVGVWNINRPVEPIDSVALCEAFRAVGSRVCLYWRTRWTQDTTRVLPQRYPFHLRHQERDFLEEPRLQEDPRQWR